MFEAEKKARKTDPSTSHEAAEKFAPYANAQGLECLEVFYLSQDRTIAELANFKAKKEVGQYCKGRVMFNDDSVVALYNLAVEGQAAIIGKKMSRRANELVDSGLIIVSGSRKCQVSNNNRQTYTITKAGIKAIGEAFRTSCFTPYQKLCGGCPACGGYND